MSISITDPLPPFHRVRNHIIATALQGPTNIFLWQGFKFESDTIPDMAYLSRKTSNDDDEEAETYLD